MSFKRISKVYIDFNKTRPDNKDNKREEKKLKKSLFNKKLRQIVNESKEKTRKGQRNQTYYQYMFFINKLTKSTKPRSYN